MKLAGFSTHLLAALLVVYFAVRLVSFFVPRLLYSLPSNLRQRVHQSLLKCSNKPNRIPVLDFGWKGSSVRRAFILAAEKPSDYTNKDYNRKIHIADADRADREALVTKLGQFSKRKILGFFHPYCNAGGGGEKVLWKAIESSLNQDENNICVVYTGDLEVTGPEILRTVERRFEYKLDAKRIVFIYLRKRYLVEAKRWPKFTLLGQAMGSIALSIEALTQLAPDCWIDTMGYPFGYPFVSLLANIPVITYTHYPVISTDMLGKLRNVPGFSRSIRLVVKYAYWLLFMLIYKFAGRFVSIATTNSTWTYNHIKSIWPSIKNIHTIYPPCSTEILLEGAEKVKADDRINQAVVIAQFRPEKRHRLILSSFADFLHSETSHVSVPKLVLIGSTRNSEDRAYVLELETYAFETLKIPRSLLEFKTDCSYPDMKKTLYSSWFGINAMWNEHFGIAVVEYMASGLIPICHASAGPLYDIVVPWNIEKNEESTNPSEYTGLFFRDSSDPDHMEGRGSAYISLAQCFKKISKLTVEDRSEISNRAKMCSLAKFSDARFEEAWRQVLNEYNLMDSTKKI